jgi:hypothetical protein
MRSPWAPPPRPLTFCGVFSTVEAMPITKLCDYINKCLEYKTENGNVALFRGEHDTYSQLLPSIYRRGYDYLAHEHIIFKETLSRFPDEMAAQQLTVEKLIFMQHYEIPTRLMDISRNPLAGLFFACYANGCVDAQDRDGRIFVFSVPENEMRYCDSDTVSLIANLCERPPEFSVDDEFGLEKLVRGITEREKPNFEYAKYYHDRNLFNQVLCVRPRWNNPRIIRQDGYFLLFGIDEVKAKPARINPAWKADEIVIPGGKKEALLDELDYLNINESFFFPDYKHLANTFSTKYKKSEKTRPCGKREQPTAS